MSDKCDKCGKILPKSRRVLAESAAPAPAPTPAAAPAQTAAEKRMAALQKARETRAKNVQLIKEGKEPIPRKYPARKKKVAAAPAQVAA